MRKIVISAFAARGIALGEEKITEQTLACRQMFNNSREEELDAIYEAGATAGATTPLAFLAAYDAVVTQAEREADATAYHDKTATERRDAMNATLGPVALSFIEKYGRPQQAVAL